MSQISVIVPVYKVEAYLPACIDSILAQTFTDFELILIDDGSPDHCGTICDEYAKKDVRIHVIHQENGGLSAARNAGIDWVFKNSDSQWITFVDSDDMIISGMLERLRSVILITKADVCTCSHQRFDDSLNVFQQLPKSNISILSGRDACHRLYDNDGTNMTIACAKLYSRHLFKRIRYPLGKLHEDEYTTYKLLFLASNVAEINEPYYAYRINHSSIMNSVFSSKRFDALEALKYRKIFFENRGEVDLARKTQIAYRTTHAKLIVLANSENKKSEIPAKYRMTLWVALRRLQYELPNDKFTYYLSLVYPNWIYPHEYLRKLKKILHIPYPS